MVMLILDTTDQSCSKKGARRALWIAVRTYSENTALTIDLLSNQTQSNWQRRLALLPKSTNRPKQGTQKSQPCSTRYLLSEKQSARQNVAIVETQSLRAS
jgi:hypothetical protein